MQKHSRIGAAGWIAAGALAGAALLAPATAAASGPTLAPQTAQGGCGSSLFSWDVATGRNDYAMLTVHVQAKSSVPGGCSVSFSLNSYTAQGPTWPTSGTQALFDHQSVTLSAGAPSGTLTVAEPPCYGQTDLYTGTARFDGKDGALPHYPNSVTPAGLIAYSNGGAACEQPSSSPSQKPSESPSQQPSQPVESEQPSTSPSEQPSEQPSTSPSEQPSEQPSQPVDSEQPSTSPSDPPSDGPTPSASASASPTPSASASDSPSPTPSESASASASPTPSESASQPASSPSGSVLGATGTPQITPPPTDALGAAQGSAGSGLPLVLAAVSALLLAALAVTPSRRRSRR